MFSICEQLSENQLTVTLRNREKIQEKRDVEGRIVKEKQKIVKEKSKIIINRQVVTVLSYRQITFTSKINCSGFLTIHWICCSPYVSSSPIDENL